MNYENMVREISDKIGLDVYEINAGLEFEGTVKHYTKIAEDEKMTYEDLEVALNNALKETKIDELVKIELDECCHDDYIKDYETPLDFYLSNAIQDSYVTHFLPEHFDLNEEELYEIQSVIIDRIKESVE
ncbi:hypothetical protein [Peptostreptococcus porci]|uniref:hypothetical protein n=1 Tax=Peptostreptococcus porci TaxID=2652282 RepID=UPI002A806849|nr:hypothetical protein [Peptostreptococcus porci]MDY4127605.1 hypothetical protein [Peptostreptococcus porci]